MKSITVKNTGIEESITMNSIKQGGTKDIVKVSTLWHFVEWYLEMLQNTGAIKDEEFSRYFKQLSDYVHSKFKMPQADILDEYVVYEFKR